jgi:gliding motility-associated-like protein
LLQKNKTSIILCICILLSISVYGQNPLFEGTPVSDSEITNTIGSANTTRNISADSEGNIYVVYGNPTEIRITKSVDSGQSFLPSLLVGNAQSAQPEIAINNTGIVYVAWANLSSIFFSLSTDNGQSFTTPRVIGNTNSNNVHMSSYESNIYITDQNGRNLFTNNNNGIGDFNVVSTGVSMMYADALTDQNGVVYLPMDDPNLILFQSTNQGGSLETVNLTTPGQVFFSSYALSDGPCGTFIFVGGGLIEPSDVLGYKINVKTGDLTEINLGSNVISEEGRTLFADSKGTLIDGYRSANGDLTMSISSDQGNTFNAPIVIANGESHNISRDPKTENILVVYEKSGQIFLSVYDNVLKNVEITEPNPALFFCQSESFDISFTITGEFDVTSEFRVSLSDEFGSFSNSVQIGSVTTNVNGVINCTLPGNLPPSDLYRLQVESLENCIQSNKISLTIGEADITGPRNVCVDENIQLVGSGTPNSSNPWLSSDTSIATITDDGVVTGISAGTTEISYATNNSCAKSFILEVFALPTVVENVSLQQCDNDTDGFSDFNLTEVNAKIIANPADFTFTYFETEVQAENNDAPINNATAYRNEVQSIDKVWARIENNNGCFSTSEINLTVSTTQIPADFTETFYECDDGTNISDGIATFDFSSVTDNIKAIFPVNQELEIKYYRNEADALAELNEIADVNNYQNIGFPNQQDIYVRVDSNLNNACLGLGVHVSLNVETVPVANEVVIDIQCDNDRDGFFSFDTSTIQSEILGSQTDVSVSYFDEDGNSLSSPLPNPFITAGQIITAAVTNTTSQDTDGQCSAETTLSFIVNSVPIANIVPIQEACDDDSDGIIGFDTSAIESTVIGNQTGLVIKYFDENDIELSSPLPNPFFTSDQTIKVRLENPLYDICFEETFVDFRVKEKPTFDLPDEEIICITDNPEVEVSISNPNNANNTYVWRDENNNIISNSATAIINQRGFYSVIATSPEGCASDQQEILIKESSISTITINNVTVIDDSDNNSIEINTANLGLGDYEFRLLDENDVVVRNYQDEPFFDGLESGVYSVEVNDKNNCGSVPFEVSLLSFPEFFTPNGDNVNDYWQIKGLSKNFYKTGFISVFNRYGKLITKFTIDDLGWDGNENGRIMMSNDYWFYVELVNQKNEARVRRGNFSLLRK